MSRGVGQRRPGDWVFAYGSNMHLPDLARWLREHGHPAEAPRRAVPARLPDHALAWNYRSRARRGGAANVVRRLGAEVRGVALLVSARLLEAIDHKEGHPNRYDRGAERMVARALADGSPLDAWVYRVTPAHQIDEDVPPRRGYLGLMIEAAETHGLGEAWLCALRALPTLD